MDSTEPEESPTSGSFSIGGPVSNEFTVTSFGGTVHRRINVAAFNDAIGADGILRSHSTTWGQSLSRRHGLNGADLENLTQLLTTGKPGGEAGGQLIYHRVDNASRGWYNVYTRSGGYAVMVKSSHSGPFFLNLDHGDLIHRSTLNRYREQILDLADGLGKKLMVLPLGLTALRNGPAQYAMQRAGVEAISTEGREAVLNIPAADEVHTYLSGYDDQESPPLYFLCRLPGAAKTVAEAREMLKPGSVRLAEKEGKRVERQGDLFAIRSDLTDEDILAAGGKIYTNPACDVSPMSHHPHSDELRLYGTVHSAQRVARMPNGMELATGMLLHQPSLARERRGPDHRPRVLDSGWWFVIPNTVPKNRGSARRRAW